jgi:hypothetical protein
MTTCQQCGHRFVNLTRRRECPKCECDLAQAQLNTASRPRENDPKFYDIFGRLPR